MMFSISLLYAEEHHLSSEIVQQNTKLEIPQIEAAYKHILSMKTAARVIQSTPPVFV